MLRHGVVHLPMSNTEPTVWIRALRWHTYQGKKIEEGDIYLAYEKDVETITSVVHKFGVIDTPPPRATRTKKADGA